MSHYGEEKVAMALKRKYYWPGMSKDLKRWLKACETCMKFKDRAGGGKHPLKKEIHGEKWSKIQMDIIGPFKKSDYDEKMGTGGNQYCLVVIDLFTKWAEGYPLRCHTAEVVAETLASGWYAQHRQPDVLQSDGAPEFVGEVMDALAVVLGYEKGNTNPYRPQSNGLVERMNRTLKQQLSCLCEGNPNHWDKMVPYVFSAYRCCTQKSTGLTPYLMVYGEERKLPVDLQYEVPNHCLDFPCAVSYVEQVRKMIRFAGEFARRRLGLVAVYQKTAYDNRARPREFEPGDVVFRFDHSTGRSKIGQYWDGPYVVTKKKDCTYWLKTALGEEKFHVDYLRPWLNRKGNIRVVNLYRAAEYKRQMKAGVEILVVDSRGRVVPGKDCPQVTLTKYEDYGLGPAKKRRQKWKCLVLDEQEMDERKWIPIKTRRKAI